MADADNARRADGVEYVVVIDAQEATVAEDITVTTMEGRPVDPQVPGTTHDMDAAVATLLARHDATRTDGNPPWPPSWARYGTMWEERDKALAEVDRLRAALTYIASGDCFYVGLTGGTCRPDDRCDVCTARAAIDG